jgi:serine/threonine protein kinase
VMIKRTELGYTTKLIDFDSSYIVGSPPPPEEIVGTMNYYSPELVRYIQGSAAPGELTEASDIFALGLIYAEYLTGAMPPFDPAHHEAAIAVLHGQALKVGSSRAPTSVNQLVERMLLPDPAARPSVAQVHSTLMGLRGGGASSTTARAPVPIRTTVATRASTAADPTTSPRTAATRRPPHGAPSALRGKGVRIAGGTAAAGPPGPTPSTPPTPPAPPASSLPHPETPEHAPDRAGSRGRVLLGRLLGKLEERRSR